MLNHGESASSEVSAICCVTTLLHYWESTEDAAVLLTAMKMIIPCNSTLPFPENAALGEKDLRYLNLAIYSSGRSF